MRKIRVTFNITTNLTPEQVRPLFEQVGYPAIQVENLLLETTFIDKITALEEMILSQKRWIEEHGGDLAGYIKRYGSVNDAEYSGVSGEAIYAADTEALKNMEILHNAMKTRMDIRGARAPYEIRQS